MFFENIQTDVFPAYEVCFNDQGSDKLKKLGKIIHYFKI